jgi:beta-glucosidase/6-phospho-beta-glucosidase/beta-galactosidase
MRDTVGDRLPTFTEEQKKMIIGATDFVAINYYFPYLITPGTASASDADGFYKDMNITTSFGDWPLSQTGWGIYGPGLRDLLVYSQQRYPTIPLYVTENGLAWKANNVTDAVNDVVRQSYLRDHINAVGEALKAGVDIRGYFVWSFQDNLEWNSGFEMTFGLIYIERPSMKRIVKDSLRWYSKAIKHVQGN